MVVARMKHELGLYRFKWGKEIESLIITTPEQLEAVIGEYIVIKEQGGWLEPSDFVKLPIPLSVIIGLKESVGNTLTGVHPVEMIKQQKERKSSE